MKASTRFFAAAFLALLFTACSTVQSRIKQHPDTFQALSAADRDLVSHGKIRAGLPKDAVYIAWGRADAVTHSMNRGRRTEVWNYFAYEQQPVFGFGAYPVCVNGGYAFIPGCQSGFVSYPYPWKQAVFQNERVIAWTVADLR